jgi:hypothetical protein
MLEERFEKRRRLSRIVRVAVCLAGAAVGSLAAAKGPEVSPNVPVNAPQQLFPHDNPTRSTSSITASLDGRRMLVAFEDLQGLCGSPGGLACPPDDPNGLSGYSFSTDGGATWTDGGAPFALDHETTAGHPWVDRLGRVFELAGNGDAGNRRRDGDTYFYVTRMQDETTGAANGGLGIYRGHFGANTFVFDDGQLINSPHPAGDQYSRPAVAAAKDGGANAYIALVNVEEICNVPFAGFGQIEVWRTHDGGTTWQGPAIAGPESSVILDPNDPQCGNEGFLQIAPAISIGRHGEIYVVWQYGPHFFPDGSNTATDAIRFAASFDGGKTFTKPVDVAALNAMRANPPVGYAKNRMNDQPRIAVSVNGATRGRIYVTYYSAASPVSGPPAAQSLVSSQAFIIHSDDRGKTWSTPVALAAPVPATGLKRLWPTVSVRPDGNVDVVYLDSREVATGTPCSVPFNPTTSRTGPASSLVDTFWVQSRDGGATFSTPLKVSTETSDWCKAPYQFDAALPADGFLVSNAGDYIGSMSLDDRTLAVWPDDRNGPMDTFFAEIRGLARGHR